MKFDAGNLMNGLIEVPSKMDIAVKMFAETHALNLQNDAREQAKWEDRTGDARKRLNGYSNRTVKGYRITLAHGVDYGMWLELAHEKKFAIVEPIIRLSSPYIMQDFQGMLNKIR